jgi:hypothetical protein
MKRSVITTVVVAVLALAGLFGLNRRLQDPANGGLPVPDVTGLSLSKANEALHARELLTGPIQAIANDARTGTVLQQSVAPGTQALPTTPVNLIVSAGPNPQPDERKRVTVGGTCEVMATPPPKGKPCIGAPLMVPLLASLPTSTSPTPTPTP